MSRHFFTRNFPGNPAFLESVRNYVPDCTVFDAPPEEILSFSEAALLVLSEDGWTEHSIWEMSVLAHLCRHGGVWISPEVLLLQDPSPLFEVTPFCASSRSNLLLPAVFGFEANSAAAEMAIKTLEEMLSFEKLALREAQQDGSVLIPIFEKLFNFGHLNLLPHQSFAIFGVQRHALQYIEGDEKKRELVMSRMEGRIQGKVLFGIFGGVQILYGPNRFSFEEIKKIEVTPRQNESPVLTRQEPEIEAGVFQMAKGLGGAALGAIGRLVVGKPVLVSETEVARRKAFCTGDENRPPCEWYNVAQDRCAKCGCFARFKSRLQSSSCPVGKW